MVLLSKVQFVALHGSDDRQSVSEVLRRVESVVTGMAEYIEKEAAINAGWNALYEYEDETEKQFMADPELNIDDWFVHRIFVQVMHGKYQEAVLRLPAANVRENVKARWKGAGLGDYSCSWCGEVVSGNNHNFCPNCGAEMGGGDDGERI